MDCLAVADAQDRENCCHCLLCSGFGVSEPAFLNTDIHNDGLTLYRCCVIGIVRFWQIYVIDLIGNLTGTSLTTFMLCTVELMLAGLCINIPMLRPFYLRWRTKYKSSSMENSNSHSGFNKGSRSGQLKVQPKPGQYTAWIELVRCHLI